MRFMEWLRINELTSMSQIDSSGVELKKVYSGSYEYKFDVTSIAKGYRDEGNEFDDFTVTFYRVPSEMVDGLVYGKMVGGKMVDGIWSVAFKRGDSYSLTGASGSGGTAVYGKVLAAVKKLTEVEEVNGLKFIGADPRQDIMYDKFLKALGGFTPVGGNIYLKDEYIKANASEEDLKQYKGFGEKREIYLHNLKVVKAASRNKGLIGKITGYSNYPAIILNINSSALDLLVWNGRGVSKKNIDSDELEYILTSPSSVGLDYIIASPSSIDPSLISSLMGEIQKDDSDLSKYLKTLGLKVDGSTYDFGFKKETA